MVVVLGTRLLVWWDRGSLIAYTSSPQDTRYLTAPICRPMQITTRQNPFTVRSEFYWSMIGFGVVWSTAVVACAVSSWKPKNAHRQYS